ncbi:hypothetical protein CUC08_Gglean003368 [Alternaria sp. MG1]|nr:hypothetical protein CUC08_Gglean003368 [Alternaria sp. MG1]
MSAASQIRFCCIYKPSGFVTTRAVTYQVVDILTSTHLCEASPPTSPRKTVHQRLSHFRMKLLIIMAAITSLALGAPKDPYPAPCGRSDPSGICTTKATCYKKGGFYVQRDCTFYNVLDIGCCYSIPDEKK